MGKLASALLIFAFAILIAPQSFAQNTQSVAHSIDWQINGLKNDLVKAENEKREGDANRIREHITGLQQDKAQLEGDATDSQSLCAEEAKRARSTCTLGMEDESAMALKAAITAASQMMASGGTEKACKAAKTVQMLSSAANTAHAGMCQAQISSCVTTCTNKANPLRGNPEQRQIVAATDRSAKSCAGLKKHVIAAGVAAFTNVIGFAMGEKCQKAVTNNAPLPGSSPPQAYDCSNPMMAGMAQCVCAANPADPMCSGSNVGLGDGAGFSSGGGGAVDGGAKDPEMFGFDDEIAALAPNNQGGGSSEGGGGGGGGGMNGGGGAGALPPEETGGGGEGPYNTDIMGGLTGGGGGGSGGSYGSGGGSGGSGGGGSMFDTLADKFNLKGFLPSKADFKNRGLASGNGADGITGPNGPSLFEKVSARYHKKQSELLP